MNAKTTLLTSCKIRYYLVYRPHWLLFLVGCMMATILVAQLNHNGRQHQPPQNNTYPLYQQKHTVYPVTIPPQKRNQVNTTVATTLYYQPTTTQNKGNTLSENCAPDTVILTSQQQIDEFANTYPGCTKFKRIWIKGKDASPAIINLNGLAQIEEITEQLLIDETNITTLAGLTGLKKVGIGFDIFNNPDLEETGLTGLESLGIIHLSNLPSLSSLAGLTNNLTNHNTYTLIISGTQLTDLTGLEGIHSMPNMYILGNPQLTSLNGLENLTECGGGITLIGNINLTSISALAGITALPFGSLELSYNYSLTQLEGLDNITLIKKKLWINWNVALQTLAALNDDLIIEDEDGEELKLVDNWQLTFCAEPAICTFIANGGAYEIAANGSGCQTIAQIQEACGLTCPSTTDITFTGIESEEWENPANWSLNRIPQFCDRVIIPSYKTVVAHGNKTIAYLNIQNSNLDMSGFSLYMSKGAYMYQSQLNQVAFCRVNVEEATTLLSSDVEGSISFVKVAEALHIQNTNIYQYHGEGGHLTIEDVANRQTDVKVAYCNIAGNLNTNISTQVTNAETVVLATQMDGDLAVTTHHTEGNFYIGSTDNDEVSIGRHLILNTQTADYPKLQNIIFRGYEQSNISQAGPASVVIEKLRTEKNDPHSYIVPQTNLYISGEMQFGSGIIKPNHPHKVIFTSTSFISGMSSSSWVQGRVRKEGNNQFRFPVGGNSRQAPIDKTATPNDVYRAFEAEFFEEDPTVAGFDTAQRQSSLLKVSGVEYWELKQVEGPANNDYKVTLQYDTLRSQKAEAIYALRVATWHNNEWKNLGSTLVEAYGTEAFIQTPANAGQYQLFSFGYAAVRLPVVTVGTLPDSVCRNIPLKIPLVLDTLMEGGNTFEVHLSQSNGSFDSYLKIGEKSGVTNSDSILCVIPNATAAGTGYKIRIVGKWPQLLSVNTQSVTVITIPVQTPVIAGPLKVCLQSGVAKYYVVTPEAGVTYNWQISSAHASFTTQNDTAYVTWLTAGPNRVVSVIPVNRCGNGNIASLPNILIANPLPAAAPVVTTTGRWLQATQHSPVLPGIGIRWYRNGSLIAGATGYQYYASLAGSYTTRYFTDCDEGPASNSVNFAANALPQTISFDLLPNKTIGDAPFTIAASASSGLPVTLTLLSGPGNLTAGVFTITNAGTVTIRASQAGNEVYDTAAYVIRSFEVERAAQNIQFSLPAALSFPVAAFPLNATASSGLPVVYTVNSSNAYITGGNILHITAPGQVSVTANQAGNSNYFAAPANTQGTCVQVTELTSISGPPFVCPGQPATYSINPINGLTYNWRLSNGTTYTQTANSISISWATPGTYTLIVNAQGNCGAPTANDSLTVQVLNAITPGPAGNLLPANNAQNQALPLLLSWTAGTQALNYDLYVWDSGTTKPATPFASNIANFGYTLAIGSLAYNKAYHWQVVSKNACLQATSTIHTFRLRPLPDLLVSQINVPANANSGQTISIQYTVKNIGPGSTSTNQNWSDAIFLSFDTLPNFTRPPQIQQANWDRGEFPVRPLLVATRNHVTALDSGQQYTNQVDFSIPINYAGQYYAYVITNYPANTQAPQQMTVSNDTLRAPHPIEVSPSPTPDLRVEWVTAPANTFSGSTINISYRVKNYGVTTPAPSVRNDKIYISPSPLFNINNAILLKQPKANGTYYPHAKEASYDTLQQLEANAFAELQAQVVMPNFIQGTWFIHVHTNTTGSIYEGPLANNNINNTAIQIILTPTPSLVINNLNVPFTQASTTQSLSLSYQVLNAGFTDNAQRNKGHYYVATTCAGGNGFRDSLGHGGSNWQDAVYLSTNANELIPSQALLLGTLNHSATADAQETLRPTLCPATIKPANLNTTNVLRAGSIHPQTFNFKIPNQVQPGTYYLYVQANHNKLVYQFPDTPVVRRSAAITINRPNLAIQQWSVPANATGGQLLTLTYTVKNTGAGGIFNATRRDLLYVSNSAIFDYATATFIGEQTVNTNLTPNAESTHSFNYTFAEGSSGTRYLHLIVNNDSTFTETSYTNNRSSAAVHLSTATAADLVLSNLQLPDTVKAYQPNAIRYTITNHGPAAANGQWVDYIYVSCSPVFNTANAYLVQTRTQTRSLAPGASVKDSFSLVPEAAYLYHACFGTQDESNANFFVVTNATNSVFEGTNTSNNTLASGLIRFNNTHVDHIVTQVSGNEAATVGRPYPVNWQVQNLGLVPSAGGWTYRYSGWYDAIYFSPDTVLNSNAVFAGWKLVTTRLNTNHSYQEQMSVTVPKLASGNYYVHVVTAVQNGIRGELNTDNNSNLIRQPDGKPQAIPITQPPLPDLTAVIANAPTITAAGQPMHIRYQVTNQGTGNTFPNTWTDNLWLSTDLIPNNGNDILLGSRTRAGGLAVTATYTDSITATLPLTMQTGNYIIIVHTDGSNAVIEQEDNNNLAFAPVAIFTPAPADLMVQQVQHPDTAWLGYPITNISWQVHNASANNANGQSADGIYLSTTGEVDSSAVLQGILNKNISLAPLASQPFAAQPIAKGVPEGLYHMVVKADVLNNIAETNKGNNTAKGAAPIFMGVKPLHLDVPETNTLHTLERFYKLQIPDALIGATILVTLKTGDSLTLKNELYAGAGYIPSAARHDHRFDIPNSGNQTLLIPSANTSHYYLLVRSVTPNAPLQNITLTAVKLPFAILTVQSNSGGNGGNVTVRINGSLFIPGMIAKLSKPGTTIQATRVFYVNGGQVFATFPLQAKPLGLYTVSLHKPDGSIAALANSFAIVLPGNGGLLTGGGVNTGPTKPGTEPGCDPGADAGLNSLLVTELIYPPKVFNGQTFPVQIKFTNPTNMDIPAPTRVLYNDYQLKMSPTLATVDSGTSPLVLQLAENGGPPGIIRAGGSGTITIHSRAPLVAGQAIVTFTIK